MPVSLIIGLETCKKNQNSQKNKGNLDKSSNWSCHLNIYMEKKILKFTEIQDWLSGNAADLAQ